MTGKVLNGNSTAILILILPFAVGMIVLYKAWPALLILLLLSLVWRVWDNYQWNQRNRELSPFFNQLIKENQGCLTPMDLSMTTNLSGKAAKRFLERKAEEYGAIRREQGETGIVYYFLTATALGTIFDDSEPEALPESDRPSVSLISTVEEKAEITLDSPVIEEKTEEIAVIEEKAEITLDSPVIEEKTEEIAVIEEKAEIPEDSPVIEEKVEEIAVIEEKAEIPEDSTIEDEKEEEIPEIAPSAPLSFAQLAVLKEERQKQPEAAPSVAGINEEKTTNEEKKEASPFSKGLIQVDLAKRLDLNASTLGRRKSDPDFPEWSQSKDPDGIAWRYIRKTKLFVPIEG
jgi:hypothetical protein